MSSRKKLAKSFFYTVVFVALTPLLASGQDEKKNIRDVRDRWFGFPKGSWIIRSKRDPFKPRQKVMFYKLVRIDDDKDGRIRMSSRRSTNMDFTNGIRSTMTVGLGLDPDNDKRSRLDTTRKESLLIDQKNHVCTVKEYQIEGIGIVTLWHANGVDVPYRSMTMPGTDIALFSDVVRAKCAFKGARRAGSFTIDVASFKDQLKIGKRRVECVREEINWDVATTRRVQGKGIRWLSNSIPGRIARFSVTMNNGPTILAYDVKDFFVAKKAPK